MQIRKKQHRLRDKIRVRFFTFLSVSVILCAVLIAVIAATLYPREIEMKEHQSGTELLSAASEQLEEYMASLDNMAYPVMLNPTIQRALGSRSASSASDYITYTIIENCSWALQLQGAINPDFEIAIFPANSNGMWYSSLTSSRSSYNYVNADWYQRLQQNEDLSKIILPNRTLNIEYTQLPETVHLICYRMHSMYNRSTIGYMCVYLRPMAIERILDNLSESIQNLVLVDDSGAIIYSSNHEFTSGELMEFERMYGNGQTLQHGSSSYRLLTSEVDDTPWRIICTYNLSASRKAASRINTIIAVAAAIVCVFCILLLWGFLMRLLKPIEQLTIGMEWVKMGRMDFRLEPERHDELGEAMENFNDMLLQLNQANREIQSMAELQRDIQISALRQQINPHFLYNTLDMMIGMTAEGNSAATIEVCKALGGMFRYNLNGDSKVPLRHEITQIRRYMQISQHRFRNRFDVFYNIDETLLDQIVPKLIIQPLVENCVVHGISSISRPASILVAVNRSGPDTFSITIKDNGAGMSLSDLQTLRDSLTPTRHLIEGKNHIGVRNVYDRLYLIYGDRMRMDIESYPSAGTQITILLPVS